MLVHPHDPDAVLITVEDLPDGLPPQMTPYAQPLQAVSEWVRGYLTSPHPELGRTGPVCPYVPTALKRGMLYLTIQPGGRETLDSAEVTEAVLRYREWFQQIEPREGPAAQFKSIIILFPDVAVEDAPEVIDRTQAALKPAFVESGLMVGQFHPLPPAEGGLWNADFRPLRSPVPLLAIRHMVASDLPFLTKERRLLESYWQVFGNDLTPRNLEVLERALKSMAHESAGGV